MDEKHSPGPWTVDEIGGNAVLAADDETVCRCHWSTSSDPGPKADAEELEMSRRWNADARLIAQAPAMLALLREAAGECTESNWACDKGQCCHPRIAALLAAIDGKATP
jgi:hypothetical protein